MAKTTYRDDLAFLKDHTETVELQTSAGDARLAVTPSYQGRAMTSTLSGPDGASFGWLNREFIDAGQNDPTFNNYGGEDRFWLGPEAGQYGLWFESGQPFNLDHWKTPEGFNTGAFPIKDLQADTVRLKTRFDVTNYAGTRFTCGVQRTLSLLEPAVTAVHLGAEIPSGVSMIGFESENVLTNKGDDPWTRDSGLLSVWILGQFKPLPRGRVIVPFQKGPEDKLGPRVTTDYFGELPDERGVFTDGHFLFTCDGEYRSKIGVSPERAMDVLGSWDPDAGVLTVVQFSLPDDPTELPYVNSLWEMQDDPFAGDVVNSYNDGEETPGAGQLGPFYEIETSSPAAELAPGESITHVHRTFHFAGDPEAVLQVARGALGFDISEMP